MAKAVFAFFFVSIAFAQEVQREFPLKNAATPRCLQEIATTLRTVAEVYQLNVDETTSTITMRGTAAQMAMADWLIPKLDVAGGARIAVQEYKVDGNSEDVVLLFGLRPETQMAGLQQIVTTLRTVADIVKIFNVTDSKIIVLRGNANQIALARFYLTELDQSAQLKFQSGPNTYPMASVRELKLDAAGQDTAVVYGLAYTDTPQGMQEVITTLRAVADIRKVFFVGESKLLAMRGTTSEMQMAEWLITELDRQTAKNDGNEISVPGGDDDVLHVFYLSHLTGPLDIQTLLTSLRSTARIGKIFSQTRPAAIALRGTADQVAMAGRMIATRDAVQ